MNGLVDDVEGKALNSHISNGEFKIANVKAYNANSLSWLRRVGEMVQPFNAYPIVGIALS